MTLIRLINTETYDKLRLNGHLPQNGPKGNG